MSILTVNAGSSSVRLALLSVDQSPQPIKEQRLSAGELARTQSDDALTSVLRTFVGDHSVQAVAHRVVHGGTRFCAPHVVDTQVEIALESLATLAPLHNPVALRWLRAARHVLGAVPHVAAFDTAFFAGMPAAAREYPLPRRLVERYALRRYGFHGLAHASMLHFWQSRHAGGSRLITLQLGSGCSAAAIRNGRAIDTSMGFSPVAGLMMATRSGDVDPGLLTHLQQQATLTPAQLERVLNCESGLLGVADEADMQLLLTRRDDRAQLAIDMYCQRVRNYIGAYLVALGGADAILFGGGVGEHAPEVRRRILFDMQWAGVHLDDDANRAAVCGVARISKLDSPADVWVFPPDEQRELANAAIELLHLIE